MKFFVKTIFIFLVLFSGNFVFAGDVSLERNLPKGDVNSEDEVLIGVYLTTEGKEYNALEGELSVSSDLKIENVITGSSIISVWLENPKLGEDQKVHFSGIVPSGYFGKKGEIFSLLVKTSKDGTSNIFLKNINLFLNDGHGSPESVGMKDFAFKVLVKNTEKEPFKISLSDTSPPEEFKVNLIRDKNLNDGKYTLVFGTQDKGSGVLGYDVLEGKKVFKQVFSPYVLENQRLNGKIYVKAIDNAGNERLSGVYLPGKVCLGIRCVSYKTVLLVIIVFIVFSYLWLKKKRKSS